MPGIYDKLGIRFQYPENWSLETDDTSHDRQSVSVYSPGGAMWSVTAYHRDQELAELIDAALGAMRREYQELDSESVREQVGDVQLVGYDLNFYCLDLTNTALIRACRTPKTVYLIISQAEDREFDQVGAVLRAMTVSLLSEAE